MEKYSCNGIVLNSGQGEFTVKGKISSNSGKKLKLLYYASNPSTYNGSYSGSGLPFPNKQVAFENSPNQGAVLTNKDGSFEIKVKYPNSYYIDLGRTYVQPVVYIKVCGQKKVHTIKLGNGIPFRSLCHPLQRKGPSFYENDGRNILPPRTQEQLLRDKSYPNKNIMPKNFWGKSIAQ